MKKMMVFLSLILILVGCKNKEVTNIDNKDNNKIENVEEKKELASSFELKEYKKMEYYFYIPKNREDNMSLIVYLHNAPDKKVSTKKMLETKSFPRYISEGYYEDKSFKSFVIIPKIDTTVKSWSDKKSVILSLIDKVVKEYNIDKNKISLTGHSIGGEATYTFGIESDVFSCLAPLCGKVTVNKNNINKLKNKKLWVFVGLDDNALYRDSSISLVEKLNKINDNARITKYNHSGHFDVPIIAYKDMNLIDWLVNCEK